MEQQFSPWGTMVRVSSSLAEVIFSPHVASAGEREQEGEWMKHIYERIRLGSQDNGICVLVDATRVEDWHHFGIGSSKVYRWLMEQTAIYKMALIGFSFTRELMVKTVTPLYAFLSKIRFFKTREEALLWLGS